MMAANTESEKAEREIKLIYEPCFLSYTLFATSLEIHTRSVKKKPHHNMLVNRMIYTDDSCIIKLNIYRHTVGLCGFHPLLYKFTRVFAVAVFQLYFIHENTVIEY